MWILGFFANKLMNAFAPIVTQRSYAAMDTSDWLASVEADHDNWEPDELWAALNLTDPHSPPCGCESVTPAAASANPAGESSGGGHPPIHDELIEELVAEYRQKLYDWFRP
jgi:hypothetical protein